MRRRTRSPSRGCSNLTSFATLVSLSTTLNIPHFFKMSLYITGFIVALVLAALVIIWIAYCMFIRERHRSEFYHHNISDIQRRNYILEQNEETAPNQKEITAGVFVLPSRHKQKDEEYIKRPDYPESSVPISHPSTDKLIEMLNDVDADVHYREGIYEVDSHSPHHSAV